MSAPPSVAPFAGLLADLAADLRRGVCCLVVCDKGWTLPLYAALRERLRAADVKSAYLDGRPAGDTPASADAGVMLATVAQMRWAARAEEMDGVVFALPHLDVMTTVEGGWTTISREVVPLLYENASVVWLGFRDPSLAILPIVEKVFERRYVIEKPYRTLETASSPGSPEPAEMLPAPEPAASPPPDEYPPEPDVPTS